MRWRSRIHAALSFLVMLFEFRGRSFMCTFQYPMFIHMLFGGNSRLSTPWCSAYMVLLSGFFPVIHLIKNLTSGKATAIVKQPPRKAQSSFPKAENKASFR